MARGDGLYGPSRRAPRAPGRPRAGHRARDFLPGQHYVPAWGCAIRDRAGSFIVLSGDTGPNDALVDAARGADLFIVEATLLSAAEDDPNRGHLTFDEGIDMGARAGAGRTVLVHHRPQNRDAMLAALASRPNAIAGRPGLAIDLADVRSSGMGGPGQVDVGGRMDADVPAGTASRAARAR